MKRLATCVAVLWLGTGVCLAADLRLEPLAAPLEAEGLSPEIAQTLAPAGFKVLSGKSRTVCELWPCQTWAVKADFEPSGSVLYPFEMGQLLGVVRYPRKGGDFRGQEIPPGTYTLRYALQPVDGNHVGTSDTRDFLLLLPVSEDPSAAALSPDDMIPKSAAAVESTHPAMLCLLAPPVDAADQASLVHLEDRELWSLVFPNATTGGAAEQAVLSVVVQGQAAE